MTNKLKTILEWMLILVYYFSYILFAMLLYIRSGENGSARYFVTIDMREISPF